MENRFGLLKKQTKPIDFSRTTIFKTLKISQLDIFNIVIIIVIISINTKVIHIIAEVLHQW